MLELKFLTFLLLVISTVQSLETEEEVRFDLEAQKDPSVVLEPRSRYLGGTHTESKQRRRLKSPNVHIENIYIPQQIQKGEETIHGYPAYPIYTYPLAQPYGNRRKPNKNKQNNKPKPENNEYSKTLSNIAAQQPVVVLGPAAGQPGGNGEYFGVPQALLSQQTQAYPYFVIINSPLQNKYQQNLSKSREILAENADDKEADESEEESEEVNSQILENAAKPSQKPVAAVVKRTRPQLKLKHEDFPIVKYLSENPQEPAHGEERRNGPHLKAEENNGNSEDHEEDSDAEEDEEDDDLAGSLRYAYNGDRKQAGEGNKGNKFPKLEDFFNTKGNKLPLDFIMGSKNSNGKLDDRVALVFLRHSKRGRQLVLEQN